MVGSIVSRPCLERTYQNYFARERPQQVLRPTFNDIRDSVPVPLAVVCDALARKFHKTRDMTVKIQLEHLLKRDGRLKEPWVFCRNAGRKLGEGSRPSAMQGSCCRMMAVVRRVSDSSSAGVRSSSLQRIIKSCQPKSASCEKIFSLEFGCLALSVVR